MPRAWRVSFWRNRPPCAARAPSLGWVAPVLYKPHSRACFPGIASACASPRQSKILENNWPHGGAQYTQSLLVHQLVLQLSRIGLDRASPRPWTTARRPVSLVPPDIHSSQRTSVGPAWPTPATELQHSLVVAQGSNAESRGPAFLPFGCTRAVCKGEQWRLRTTHGQGYI
jgi:hypothetical protein